MGTHLKIEYTRTVTTDVAGDEIFVIVSECIDPGTVGAGTGLVDTGVFLFSIFNSRNAAADEFQRVCSINDLETYSNDRDVAVAANQQYWRSYVLTRTYTELTTGVSAVTAIGDRVNALVNDYASYISDFKTSPPTGDKTYPTADADYVTALKATYDTTVDDFDTAVLAESAAKVERDFANVTLTSARASLLEWQEANDIVEGGNLSGSGNEYGLAPYTTVLGSSFENLYNASGGAPLYPTNTVAVEAAMLAYIASVENVQGGSGATVRLTVTPGTVPVATDIGRAVTASGGTGAGYLISYDNTNNYWWVGNATGTWLGNAVVTGGTAATSAITADSVSLEGPFDGLATLAASHVALGSTNDKIAITDGILATAGAAGTDAGDAITFTNNKVISKGTAVSTAETALNTKETAYIEAQAATQAAYDVVIVAYTDVKVVCPDWSPVPPVPAAP